MKKLAVIFPGVGYTCTKPLLYYTASMAAERGYEIIRLTSEEIEEIQNYRLILETGYLRNCYHNLTKLQLSELTRIADRCLSPESTVWEHWEANTEFHLTLLLPITDMPANS